MRFLRQRVSISSIKESVVRDTKSFPECLLNKKKKINLLYRTTLSPLKFFKDFHENTHRRVITNLVSISEMSFQECHINRIIRYVTLQNWLFSPHIIS